jgi:hypothetical protein
MKASSISKLRRFDDICKEKMHGSKSMDTKSSSCLVPNPWTPRLLVVLLSTISMGAKSPLLLGNRCQVFTFYAQLQNPWTPRLLTFCSAPLVGTKSPTTWPGDLTPPFCSYSQPSKCIYHSSRQSNLPRDYFLPWHSPGSRQSCAHIAALVDSHTVSCSVVNHHHTLNSFVPLFVRGFLLDAIGF